MNNIYDNGALMLGHIQDVIMYIENDETLETWEYEDLLKELKDLRDIDYNAIVCINYENPMGYDITYWTSKDKIRKGSDK